MRARLIAVVVLAFAVGALAAVAFVPSVREGLLGIQPSRIIGKASVGGPFTMVDHAGRRVTEKDFAGNYLLVYFGFTFCPDVCPAGLQVITRALEIMGDGASGSRRSSSPSIRSVIRRRRWQAM